MGGAVGIDVQSFILHRFLLVSSRASAASMSSSAIRFVNDRIICLPNTGGNWVGWIGVIPIPTASLGVCPAYGLHLMLATIEVFAQWRDVVLI
jgi:hypothetical protein